MFENRVIKLIYRQLSSLTGDWNMQKYEIFYAILRASTRFYALLCAFTRLIHRQFTFTRFQDYTLHGYKGFNFYPLSFKYRDSVRVL